MQKVRIIEFFFETIHWQFQVAVELNRLYTTQMTVVSIQLVTSATCFGLVWPSSGLQKLVSIKVHNVAAPMESHGLHCLCVIETI